MQFYPKLITMLIAYDPRLRSAMHINCLHGSFWICRIHGMTVTAFCLKQLLPPCWRYTMLLRKLTYGCKLMCAELNKVCKQPWHKIFQLSAIKSLLSNLILHLSLFLSVCRTDLMALDCSPDLLAHRFYVLVLFFLF